MNDEEKFLREMAAECAEDELRDMGITDEDFIQCVVEDILDGESVDVHTFS